MSFTQWLSLPSQQMQRPYANIKHKKATCGLLRSSRHAYIHQNAADRTETRLKRRHYAIPVSSFVILCARMVVSVCYIVKRSQGNGCQADRPCCNKHWCTIWAETGHSANMSISWLMFGDVVARFCRVDLAMSILSGINYEKELRSRFSTICQWPFLQECFGADQFGAR